MATIRELASIVRSKNAGPFCITLDIFFDSTDVYERVRDSGRITEATIAELYSIPEEDILGIYEIDRIMAIKVSYQRPIPAGDPRDTDVYGAQQHTPLLDLKL